MLRRKITQMLLDWKNDSMGKKKALVIKGLRQIGKTFIVREFAKENYESEIYINFKNNNDFKNVFEDNLDVNRILLDLSAKMPNAKFIPHKTLIVFDEVQECANARAALKPFVEDGRYDVIATGSLLGIRGYNKKRGKGVPTGYEHIIYMYPLDFEEFLWAKGVSAEVISYLKDCFQAKRQISKPIHDSMIRYFKEYICVGGLPEAVNTFVATNDMNRVYAMQKDILEEYKDDFGKHLDERENEEIDGPLLARIEEVFDSIPSQLAKENKKFQYSKIKTKGRSADYRSAIQWLADAGIVAPCYNLSSLELPLEGSRIDDVFKLYIKDSGLFVAMLEKGSSGDILSGNLGIYKGAIYENIIADAFSKKEKNLYYFHKDSGLEIDFITKFDGAVALIEVKAKSGKTKSASTILENKAKYHVNRCIKFGEYNVGEAGEVLTLPYYMASFI